MAKYELSIYGANDELIKRFETDKLRWGIPLKAAEIQDKLSIMTMAEQIREMSELMKLIFFGLTDEDLKYVYIDDIKNTFRQVLSSSVGKIERDNSKNA